MFSLLIYVIVVVALYHFVSFIACVVLYAVFCLSVVFYLRDVCHLCIVSYCSRTATGLKTHLQF
jgi:hypothetical protein